MHLKHSPPPWLPGRAAGLRACFARFASRSPIPLLLAFLLCPLALARGDAPAPNSGSLPEGRLIAENGQLGCLGAGRTDPASAYGWVLRPLTTQPARLHAGEPVMVQAIRRYVETASQVDALKLSTGDWAIIGDIHGGGTRLLQFAHLLGSPFTPRAAGAGSDVRLPALITELQIAFEPGAAEERLLDLFSPRLLEHNGRVYVVGSSKTEPRAASGITWIAEATVEGRSLHARKLADGVDARVAKVGADFYCAVRELRAYQTLAGAAPVHLYRSADLQTWTSLGRPAGERAFHSYDLRAGQGVLWLAGSLETNAPSISVFRVNSTNGQATEEPDRIEPVSATAPMQFDPSAAVGGIRPPLVLWMRDGLVER